jgi:probable phosphoglycerate mutase
MMITFIRHAESEFNCQGIMQGIDDPDLSTVGIRQAEALSKRLSLLRNVRIFASPLKRALDTARHITTRLDAEITVIDDLKEIDIGRFSKLTWDQAKIEYPLIFEDAGVTFWKLFRDGLIPGQELYESAVQRTERAFSEIGNCSDDRRPLVIGHGGFLRIFLAEQLGFRLVRDGVKIDNTSITCFDYHNGLATFYGINDVQHLSNYFENG